MADNGMLQFDHLGPLTLALFILKRIGAFFAYLIAFAGLLTAIYFLPAYAANLEAILLPAIFIGCGILGITILAGWLEYNHYAIYVNAEDFKLKRGMLSEEEIGIPFSRIKEVKTERSVLDQMLGVSTVIITILGDRGESMPAEETMLTLPALTKDTALKIQDALLKKAEVEEMEIEKK